jgi:bidirectional [NiFe] hydrogenase diaphorase subunit
MQTFTGKATPPNDDRRWKLIDATMRKHGSDPSALIEALHTVQETFGYLDQAALRYVAVSLRVPFSKVYGVSTFYHFFTLKPQGEHTCVVCTGTACYIKGAPHLLDAIAGNAGIKPGETTPDGKLSLLTARCVGSCGLAPAVVFDGSVAGKVTPEAVTTWVEKWSILSRSAPVREPSCAAEMAVHG